MPHYYLDVRIASAVIADEVGREFHKLSEAITLANHILHGLEANGDSDSDQRVRIEICDEVGVLHIVEPKLGRVTMPPPLLN